MKFGRGAPVSMWESVSPPLPVPRLLLLIVFIGFSSPGFYCACSVCLRCVEGFVTYSWDMTQGTDVFMVCGVVVSGHWWYGWMQDFVKEPFNQ